MKNFLIKLIIISLSFFLIGFSQNEITQLSTQQNIDSQESESLYLPNGSGLEFISLGYKNVLSDLLWFKTINYFGKHYRSDQNYKWLAHMCQLVTKLNPNAKHVYEFGASMLAWEAKLTNQSIELLNLAIKDDPTYWRYYFLRGFNYTFFLNQNDLAIKDFKFAATLPQAPAMLARMAAKLELNRSGDISTTIEFLKNMLDNTEDPSTKKAIEERINEIMTGKISSRKKINKTLSKS